MNKAFGRYVESLERAFHDLMLMKPCRVSELPVGMPGKGVYLFSESGRHLYVGRSNRLRARLQEHCRPSSGNNTAPFAFRIARRRTSRTTPTYRTLGSRGDLETDTKFCEAFVRAKDRIRRMDVRFVEEGDAKRQTLLEIYVAVALNTRYNDFETH